ncbi:hypothetical protein BU23DRAFT_258927 [Bimuria novae-zelandiae CBS 107.79]|uniref:Uncharacterized protein n=1 Tax=Bimuria novae-zelandiae CBS 107.79 TaxID=1447943 RepID=A0A6A5UUV5_9PLEO|nr:hypothetical protein BU23DRAFT_258927 [Bimuria novae-zelandiae CBS 107.79]
MALQAEDATRSQAKTAAPPLTVARFPFMKLPAELRELVYACLTPVDGYLFDFQDFFLSCKLVNREAQAKIAGNIDKYLGEVKEEWAQQGNQPLRITTPTLFAELEHVTVEFPLSFLDKLQGDRQYSTHDPDRIQDFCTTLESLATLKIACLEFSFFQDQYYSNAQSSSSFNK